MIVFVAILGVAGLFVVGVPFLEVEVVEEYMETVAYEVEVPFTSTLPDTKFFGNIESARSLEAGYFLHWSPNIESESEVSFFVEASDTVDMMILTVTQYNRFKDGDSYDYERKETETASGELHYYTSYSGTYYFVIQNIHSGFLGFGEKDIVIDSALIMGTRDEEVTRYITETEYRIEPKTRLVIKKVTLMERIMGDY